MATAFTLIDDGQPHTVPATCAGDRTAVRAADLQRALGWELKPEGLCKGGICVPIADRTVFTGDDGVDLGALAAALGRPLALDATERVAYLGISAADRTRALTGPAAPDFTLPDLNGTPHTLSDYRGRKVLLVAYASW